MFRIPESTSGVQMGQFSDSRIGFYGTEPVSRPAAYTVTNYTEDRTIDANGAVAVIGDGLATVIKDLIALGILQGTVS
jgi:hypothetical protein